MPKHAAPYVGERREARKPAPKGRRSIENAPAQVATPKSARTHVNSREVGLGTPFADGTPAGMAL